MEWEALQLGCRVLLRYSVSRGSRVECTLHRAYFVLIFHSKLCFIVAETLKLEHFLVLRHCHKTGESFGSFFFLSVLRNFERKHVLKTYNGISTLFCVQMQIFVFFISLGRGRFSHMTKYFSTGFIFTVLVPLLCFVIITWCAYCLISLQRYWFLNKGAIHEFMFLQQYVYRRPTLQFSCREVPS